MMIKHVLLQNPEMRLGILIEFGFVVLFLLICLPHSALAETVFVDVKGLCAEPHSCYQSVSEAYLDIHAAGEMKTGSGFYRENLDFDRELEFIFSGGWNHDYSSRASSAPTVIGGILTLLAGTVVLDKITLQAEPDPSALLAAAQTWMYQIQDIDQDRAVAALAATDYPLLVLEPGHNFSDYPYDTAAIIEALKRLPDGRSRLLLAYIDIGQAEDYRDYWGSDWVAPTATETGSPDFLITIDPDGWSGNYPVAYWRAEWQQIWLGNTGIIAELAGYGFDGVYLDWIEAYDDDQVAQAAVREGINPQAEMINFIGAIRSAGRALSSNFLVVAQNAPYLIDSDSDRYRSVIDGLAVEDTWFHGEGDAEWDDPGAGDLPNLDEDEWSTANRLLQYKKYQSYGLPVFSVDYCISSDNAAQVYLDAKSSGLRPLVTRVSLSRLTETPPPSSPMTNTRADGARQLTFGSGNLCMNCR